VPEATSSDSVRSSDAGTGGGEQRREQQGRPVKTPVRVGEEAVVDIGPVAHGGHFIAHLSGHTVFVRHALPGERVRISITDVSSKIVRADAIEIIEPSPDRVEAPCRWARPGGCGGCDFQHVGRAAQLALKTQVVRESMARYAGLPELDLEVMSLSEGEDDDGLRWRTRVRWTVDASGRPGLLANRTHDVVPVDECLLASPAIAELAIPTRRYPGARDVSVVEGDEGRVSVVVDGAIKIGKQRIEQRVRDREWRVDTGSFWQIHPRAAETLVSAVLELGRPAPGEHWWDLYSGVGLFSAFLAESVGVTGVVHAVESGSSAVRDARRSLHDLAQVTLHHADALRWLRAADERPDGIVLDPPRAGAGRDVVRAIAAAQPRVVVYVACDPVALARDVALFASAGYRMAGIRAYDTFPMTHHVETVAALVPVE
jgi:tRNA/tmRNA/rRNA uracil-C5-methylase (TrmA/RlmC/RlmD family)